MPFDIDDFNNQVLALNQEVSNESISGRISQALSNTLYRFQRLNETLRSWNAEKPHRLALAPLSKTLSKVRFTDIEETVITVPAGFQGNLSAYALELEVTGKMVYRMDRDTVIPTEKAFGRFLNDPGLFKEGRHRLPTSFMSAEKRDAQNQKLGAYFKQDSTASRVALSSVLTSNSEILKTYQTTDQLAQTLWTQCPPNQLLRSVDRANEVTKRAFDQAEALGQDLNSEALATLRALAQQMANDVSFYANTYTRIMELRQALETTQKKLVTGL